MLTPVPSGPKCLLRLCTPSGQNHSQLIQGLCPLQVTLPCCSEHRLLQTVCSGEFSGLPLGLSHKESLLINPPRKVPVPPTVLTLLSIFYSIYAFMAHNSSSPSKSFYWKALEAFCALCTTGTAPFPLRDSLPQQDQYTTALLTSCHTEEHSRSFAHHCPETHNPWNLYSVEVALNFRNS